MIKYYLGFTVLISWWLSSGTFWTITSLVTYYSGYQGDYKPLGFIALNSLVLFSIGFVIAHGIIRGLNLQPLNKNLYDSWLVLMVIGAALSSIPTFLSSYTLAFRDFDIFIVDSLRIIANFGGVLVVYIIARELLQSQQIQSKTIDSTEEVTEQVQLGPEINAL